MLLRYIDTITSCILPFVPIILLFTSIKIIYKKSIGVKSKPLHEVVFVLFIMYLLTLACLTINYIRIFEGDFTISGVYNLIPFIGIYEIIKTSDPYLIYSNLIGNIIMYMPFGFLISLLWKNMRALKSVVIVSICLSLAIELIQYLTGRGADIDDIMLNTIGTILGYLICLVLIKIFPRFTDRFH